MVAITQYRDPGLIGLQRLNRMLDEAFAGWAGVEPGTAITSSLFAPTDVSESPESLQITMEVPGVRSEDVKISLENNLLTIRGEKRQEAEEHAEEDDRGHGDRARDRDPHGRESVGDDAGVRRADSEPRSQHRQPAVDD